VDLPAEDATRLLDGKADLAFLIQGVRYRQKRVSGRLAASWDAVVAGVQLFRPLLLEVAQ